MKMLPADAEPSCGLGLVALNRLERGAQVATFVRMQQLLERVPVACFHRWGVTFG